MNEYIIDWDENLVIDTFSKNSLREEIVRCMDCLHYGSYDGSSWCSRTYEQVPSGTCDYQTVEPDGFCAWGERK